MGNGNTIVTYNSTGKVQPKGIFVEFPLMEQQEHSINPQQIDNKIYEEDIYRKNNYRAVKALMKVYEDGKRKDSSDCMNMLGLDIKKIPFTSNKGNGESLKKIDKVRVKYQNVSPSLPR